MNLPRYAEPKLTPRQIAGLQQGLFSFLHRYKGRDKITVREAAIEIQMSQSFIRELIHGGQLEAIECQAKGKSPNKTYVLLVRSFLVWMLKHSNIDADAWNDACRDLVETLDVPSLTFFAAAIEAKRARLARIGGAR